MIRHEYPICTFDPAIRTAVLDWAAHRGILLVGQEDDLRHHILHELRRPEYEKHVLKYNYRYRFADPEDEIRYCEELLAFIQNDDETRGILTVTLQYHWDIWR